MSGKSLISDEYMSDIADSIRTKKGTVGTMKVYEMADEIASITGGVDVDTELSISSDKVRTTGAVTLTSELTGSDYVGVSDVNLNGHLENATVKFYKMIGATPNPQVDTLLYSSITNSNGIAVANVTISETSNIYAHFDEITSKYPSSNSNTINVEYIDWRETYQEVEWVKADGNCYIHTQILPNNVSFETKCQSDDIVSDAVVLGARNTNNVRYFLNYYNNNILLIDKSSNWSTYSTDTNIHIFKYVHSSRKFYIDGVENSTNPSLTGDLYNDLTIFGYNNGSMVTTNSVNKLYYLKIWEGSTLVRDYVPCYHKTTGVIGLYDTVNSVFYDNDGTGTFTKGNDIN